MRTVAIIQARLGSERLPGKVLKVIDGRAMLEHVVERLRQAKTLDDIVVAMPDASKDDELAKFCQERGYAIFRGSEADVLSRYYEAAIAFKADVVVRITSDCPLIDSQLVDAIVQRHWDSKGNDYTCNVLTRSFPRGVDTEVVSMLCLERLHRQVHEVLHREHVTNYIHQHLTEFKTENIEREAGDRSDLRICVDTQDDLDVVTSIIKHLGSTSGVEHVIAFLDRHPEVAQRNVHVQQKSHTIPS